MSPPGPTKSNSALVLVDVQQDFITGSLRVPEAERVLPIASQLLDPSLEWSVVVASQDFHPPGHVSFASTHAREPFTEITIEPNTRMQLWPEHCVQGTPGSEFDSGVQQALNKLRMLGREVHVIQKGTEMMKESFSAFKDREDTELDDYLRRRGICNLFCMGLAGDYCVKATVESALDRGYRVIWISSGIASVGGRSTQIKVETEFAERCIQDGTFQIADVETAQALFL